MFVRNLVIDPSYAVVAISKFGAGAEEIASGGGEACDARTPAPGPETARANGGLRCSTFRNAMRSQDSKSLIHPGI